MEEKLQDISTIPFHLSYFTSCHSAAANAILTCHGIDSANFTPVNSMHCRYCYYNRKY